MTAHRRHHRRRKPRPQSRTAAQRQAFSESVAGIDKDVEQIFLNLPKLKLAVVLRHYELKYGSGAFSYAKRTYPRWQSGEVSMSGIVAERLLDLVPIALDADQQFELVKKLRNMYMDKVNLHVSCSPSDWFQKVGPAVNELVTSSTRFQLPSHVVKTVSWVVHDNAVAAQRLLEAAEIDEARVRLQYLAKEYHRIYYLLKNVRGDTTVCQTIELPQGMVAVTISVPKWGFLHRRPRDNAAESFRGTLFVTCKNPKCRADLDTQYYVREDEIMVCAPGEVECPRCRATNNYDERDLFLVPINVRAELGRDWRGNYIVTYDCPRCYIRLISPLEKAGTSETCSKCDTQFIVPGAEYGGD